MKKRDGAVGNEEESLRAMVVVFNAFFFGA